MELKCVAKWHFHFQRTCRQTGEATICWNNIGEAEFSVLKQHSAGASPNGWPDKMVDDTEKWRLSWSYWPYDLGSAAPHRAPVRVACNWRQQCICDGKTSGGGKQLQPSPLTLVQRFIVLPPFKLLFDVLAAVSLFFSLGSTAAGEKSKTQGKLIRQTALFESCG